MQIMYRQKKIALVILGAQFAATMLYAVITLAAMNYEVHRRADGYDPSAASIWIDNATTYKMEAYYYSGHTDGSIPYDKSRQDAVSKIELYPGEYIVYDSTNRCFFVAALNDYRLNYIIERIGFALKGH